MSGNIDNDGDPAQRDSSDRLGEVLTAIRFFTRLPVPGRHADLSQALWAAPLAGALIGGAGAVAAAVALWLGLPGFVSGVVALAVMAMFTGGLHEDGLADTADALAGGDADARLAAMRDSRIGVYGTLALVLIVLMKAGGLGGLAFGTPGQGATLIAAAALSRSMLAVVPWISVPARNDGLGAGLSAPPGAMVAVGLLLGLVIAGLAMRGIGFGAVFGLAILALLATLVVTTWARRVLGGYTGDVLGAAQQVSETVVILAVSSMAFGNTV